MSANVGQRAEVRLFPQLFWSNRLPTTSTLCVQHDLAHEHCGDWRANICPACHRHFVWGQHRNGFNNPVFRGCESQQHRPEEWSNNRQANSMETWFLVTTLEVAKSMRGPTTDQINGFSGRYLMPTWDKQIHSTRPGEAVEARVFHMTEQKQLITS